MLTFSTRFLIELSNDCLSIHACTESTANTQKILESFALSCMITKFIQPHPSFPSFRKGILLFSFSSLLSVIGALANSLLKVLGEESQD